MKEGGFAMIRILLRLTAIGILGFSTLASYQSFQADKKQRTRLGAPLNLPIYISHFAGRPLPLFSSKAPYAKPVAQLPDKGYYRFLYAGHAKGEWLYGMLDDQEVFLKDPSRKKVILLLGYPIKLGYLNHLYVLGLLISVLILSLMPKSQISRKYLQTQLARAEKIAAQERDARLKEQNARVEVESVLNKQMAKNEQRLKSLSQEEQKLLITEFKRKEEELKGQFEKEANEIEAREKRYAKVEISKMQASYERLNNLYVELKTDHKRLKMEGLVFDVDFDSGNYENLLKGRQYEIFFAKSLLENSSFEILRWTSDKGFEQGVKVKSNGDPDFLIQYGADLIFAVECKYRSNYYAKQKPKKIEWGYTWQCDRYKAFQYEENTPVFLALGLEGKPDKPKHNYLVSLDYLYSKSDGYHWQNNENNDEQQVVLLTDVFDRYIKIRDEFSMKAIELVNRQLIG
jgi:hypothetical protein